MKDWISIKERLPETRVLLLTSSMDIILGDLYYGTWRSPGRYNHKGVSELKYEDVTHWMPLPEPPKL